MAIVFADLVRQTVSGAPGTGSTISLGAAQTGWLTFALAGVANGAEVRYAINDNGASEIGTAIYNSAGPSLAGRTPTKSTNSNAAINASAQAIVIGCLAAEDTAITLGGTNIALNGGNISALAGPLAIGSATSVPQSNLDVITTGSAAIRGVLSEQISSDANAAQLMMLKYRGAIGSPTTVANGDFLGSFVAAGYDGTSLVRTGAVAFKVDGTVSTGNIPTDMLFFTGTTALNERMRIFASGGVGINTTTDPGAPSLSVVTAPASVGLAPNVTLTRTVGFSGGSTASPPDSAMVINYSTGASQTKFGFALQVAIQNLTPFTNNMTAQMVAISGLTLKNLSGTDCAPSFGGFFQCLDGSGVNNAQGTLSGIEIDIGTVASGAGTTDSHAQRTGLYIQGRSDNSSTPSHVNAGITVNTGAAIFDNGLQLAGTFTGGSGISFITGSTFQYGLNFQGTYTTAEIFAPTWSIAAGLATLNGVSVPLPTGSNAYSSPGFAITNTGDLFALGPTHQFGLTTNTTTSIGIFGGNTGNTAGAAINVAGPAGLQFFLLGNFSAIYTVDRTGASNFDALGVLRSTNDLTIQPTNWCYFSGFVETSTFDTGTNPNHPSGLAIGWNRSLGGGEVNLVANYGATLGATGPWDFKFQDWSGSALTDIFSITNKGGFYTNSTLSPTQLQASTFQFGTVGAVGGSINAGTADTWAAVAMTSADPTLRNVPYTSGGTIIANSFNCTAFVGYDGPGSGDPSVNGASQVMNVVMGKANAFSGLTGTGTYGQTGALWLNAFGGWNGTSFTFTQSVALTTSSKTLTVPAAPTSHAYFTGMPVSGTGIPANTIIVSYVGSRTAPTSITLNNTPTVNATETLTFTAGIVGDSPGDTYLWVGQSQVYDPNGVGIGSEIFEATSSVWVTSGGIQTRAYSVRVICAPVSAVAQSGTGYPYNGIECLVDSSGIGGGAADYGYAYYAGPGQATGFTFLNALGIGVPSVGTYFLDNTLTRHTPSEPVLKQDIEILPDPKEIILGIDPVSFRYKARKERHQLGFLATDYRGIRGVKKALAGYPGDIVRETDIPLDMQKTFNFERKTQISICEELMVPILFRGMQVLWANVDQVLDQMNGIEARVEALEGRLQ